MQPSPISIDYPALEEALTAARSKTELYQAIVNAPFAYRLEMTWLFLGIIVLLIVDEETKQIHRVMLSKTELAQETLNISAKKFEDIVIPLDNEDNCIATAIRTGEPQSTSDWQYLFTPALTPEQARLNQAAGAISFSAVYPLVDTPARGALIFSYYQYPDSMEAVQDDFMRAYCDIVSKRLREEA